MLPMLIKSLFTALLKSKLTLKDAFRPKYVEKDKLYLQRGEGGGGWRLVWFPNRLAAGSQMGTMSSARAAQKARKHWPRFKYRLNGWK